MICAWARVHRFITWFPASTALLVIPALLQVGRADPIWAQIITRTQAQTDPLIAEENAANDLYRGGKYQEALARLLRLAELVRSRFGENSANFARLLNAIGRSNAALGRTREAESFYRRALAIREQTLGRDHPDVAQTLNNLGGATSGLGRYAEAEALHQRALALYQKALGPDHPSVALSLNNLAQLYTTLGRYAQAEPLYKKALTILKKYQGQDDANVASNAQGLALLYWNLGRFAEAEPLYKRALAIREETLGLGHPDVATTLNDFALLYRTLGRYSEAEALNNRALSIHEKVFGPDHAQVAADLNNLSLIYEILGRYAEANTQHRRALAIFEKALGPGHATVAMSLNNLARIYQKEHRHADAELLLKRAIAIKEEALGPNHPSLANSLFNLANVYLDLGRMAEAEPLHERALAIRERVVGSKHPDVAESLKDMARLYLATRRISQALDASRRSAGIVIGLLTSDPARLGVGTTSARSYLEQDISILRRAMTDGLTGPQSMAEAFEVAQWANQSSAAAALNQMAARFATGSDALATLIREQQDASSELHALDGILLGEISKPDNQRDRDREDAMRQRMTELDHRLQQSSVRIAAEFPRYADLANPKPLSPAEAQELLGPEEALVAFCVTDPDSFVWVITRDKVEWRNLNLSRADLDRQVQKLRASLDLDALSHGSQLFDLADAHALYVAILGQVEAAIADKSHLIVVPSGALTSLPLHVLVTERPPAAKADPSTYRSAAWLMRRHAVTVLPSVASLKALREVAAWGVAPKPFLGFGDPIFDGEQKPSGPERSGNVVTTDLSYPKYFRGAAADVNRLRMALPPLPDTADELRAVAHALGVPESQIKLGSEATERAVKSIKLDDYRIVHFATHALVAGETALFNEPAEPALALTLPQTPSEIDDGLLTSSEVATLKLNAEWVILSACNTAAAEKPGAEALSGLARAFFYAGAKALLVSHWPVQSAAAVRLTTGAIQALEQDRTLSPAEALRRAMTAFVDDPSDSQNSYPGLWAPFVIVGGVAQAGG